MLLSTFKNKLNSEENDACGHPQFFFAQTYKKVKDTRKKLKQSTIQGNYMQHYFYSIIINGEPSYKAIMPSIKYQDTIDTECA